MKWPFVLRSTHDTEIYILTERCKNLNNYIDRLEKQVDRQGLEIKELRKKYVRKRDRKGRFIKS